MKKELYVKSYDKRIIDMVKTLKDIGNAIFLGLIYSVDLHWSTCVHVLYMHTLHLMCVRSSVFILYCACFYIACFCLVCLLVHRFLIYFNLKLLFQFKILIQFIF